MHKKHTFISWKKGYYLSTLDIQRIQTVTLEEVAARAGVSAGTVSRVLNGKNKENRPAIARRSEKIRKIASELGYRPNAAARSMLRGAFQAAAFVTCGDTGFEWYPIAGLNGIHEELAKSNWRLIYNEMSSRDIRDPDIVPQILQESAVDGLILNVLPPLYSDDIISFFEAQMFPCVWFNLKRKLRSVYPDDQHGSQMAIEYLVKRGYKRIGYYSRSSTQQNHYSLVDRYNGFIAAMKKAGLPAHRCTDIAKPHNPKLTPRQQAAEFMKAFPDADAILCYEREEAIQISLVGESVGRSTPDDLEVVAFSEHSIVHSIGLECSTLYIPFKEIGIQSVQMLLEMLATGNRDVPSIAVPYHPIDT